MKWEHLLKKKKRKNQNFSLYFLKISTESKVFNFDNWFIGLYSFFKLILLGLYMNPNIVHKSSRSTLINSTRIHFTFLFFSFCFLTKFISLIKLTEFEQKFRFVYLYSFKSVSFLIKVIEIFWILIIVSLHINMYVQSFM